MVALDGLRLGAPDSFPAAPDASEEHQGAAFVPSEPCAGRRLGPVVVFGKAGDRDEAAKFRAQVGFPPAAVRVADVRDDSLGAQVWRRGKAPSHGDDGPVTRWIGHHDRAAH